MDFKDFIGDKDERISKAASILAEAKTSLEHGDLTREQFDEIAEDAMQITTVEDLADDLERKIAIQKAVDVFKMIIKALPK